LHRNDACANVLGVEEPDYLGRSIGRTAKFVRMWGDRRLAPVGATVTDWILLRQVDAAPAPGMSQSEVARFTDMSGPALVRHLDRLEDDGILVRTRDSVDRRIMRISLTPAGRKRLEELRAVIESGDRELRARLTAQEARTLVSALDKLFDFTLAELQTPRREP
jgi:MarR family transcriptional regulator, transcriptional regulator for hemolysin